MKVVSHLRLQPGMSVDSLVRQMRNAGVLGAGKVGKATELVAKMFSDRDYTVFLSIAGPMVPAGLRHIISSLVRRELVNVIVSTGANVVHDMIEALGFKHQIGSFAAEDSSLKLRGLGRIGDIYISQEAFEGLERWLRETLSKIPESARKRISSSELLYKIGGMMTDPDSIVASAARRKIPIFCPNIIDSIAGFQFWLLSQEEKLILDPLLDTGKIVETVYEAKKSGAIILGGGWPKHYTLFANTFRDGVDSAVQITMDRPEPGGLSGASLDEAISWRKIKPDSKTVTVVSDATIVFPLIVAAALDRVKTTNPRRAA